jgi:hypothetical protein
MALPPKGTINRPPSLVGKTVDQYKLCDKIGSGSYAAVYTAQEKVTFVSDQAVVSFQMFQVQITDSNMAQKVLR